MASGVCSLVPSEAASCVLACRDTKPVELMEARVTKEELHWGGCRRLGERGAGQGDLCFCCGSKHLFQRAAEAPQPSPVLSFPSIMGGSSCRKENEPHSAQPEACACTLQTVEQTNAGLVGPALSPYLAHVFKPTICQHLLGLPPPAGDTSKQSHQL